MMMDGFEKLQELGAKKIASATHIPVGHVDNILNREFSQFSKPQFFGFISILEREYKIDLSGLKQEYLFAIAQEKIEEETSFDPAERSSKPLANKKIFYGVSAALAVLLLVLYFRLTDFSPSNEQKLEINNTAINQAKKNLHLEVPVAENIDELIGNNEVESVEFGQDVPDDNATASAAEKVSKGDGELQKENRQTSMTAEPTMPPHLRIVPRGKLWLGIIDAESHKRRVEIITKPLELDGEKEWLIVTGYGYLDMECGDTTKKYKEPGKLLFLYEHGVCQQIDKAEFKARNKGKLW
ncbi:MAG: hypothetical protein MUP09_06655 [Thiovulaceae bacterium]|nr:hypothetical protein [Sulfurimonadaceae bacterium]